MCYVSPTEPKKSICQKGIAKDQKSTELVVIQNFHTYTVNGIKINVNNVCAADAILHCLGNICMENDHFLERKGDHSLMALLTAYINGDEENVYHNRVKLLLECKFEVTVNSFSEISINGAGNVFNAIQMMCLETFPSLALTRSCKCGVTKQNVSIIEIDFKRLAEEGIANLSSCILIGTGSRRFSCKKCQTELKTRTEYSKLLFLDMQPMQTCEGTISLPKITLKSIPLNVEVKGVQYSTQAVIEYRANEGSLGHYVAHCLRNKNWFEFDDLSKKIRKSLQLTLLEIHALVCAQKE